MGIFDFLKGPDLDQGLSEYRAAPGAVLLDVRTLQEYQAGHLPDSRNIPLQALGRGEELPADLDTPIFVYCHSGARSRQAAALLARMGYRKVKNIGGIAAYHGKVVR